MKLNSLFTAAILLALAVTLGAFGAHGLKDRLPVAAMLIYEKAVFYHFVHALGLLAVAILQRTRPVADEKLRAGLNTVCLLLTFGILVFSGSLYALALTDIKWLGAITPLGGTAFIVAWLLLAKAARA